MSSPKPSASSTVPGGDGDTPPFSGSNTPVAVSGTTSGSAASGFTAVAVSGTTSVSAASGSTAVAVSGTTSVSAASGSTAVAVSGTTSVSPASGSTAAASGTMASAAPAPAQAPAQAPEPLKRRKAPADPKPGSRALLNSALKAVTLDNTRKANAGIKRARKIEEKREKNFKKQKHEDNMSEDEGDYPDSHTETSDAGSD